MKNHFRKLWFLVAVATPLAKLLLALCISFLVAFVPCSMIAQTPPDSCLWLFPHNPDAGKTNYDSVEVDTCDGDWRHRTDSFFARHSMYVRFFDSPLSKEVAFGDTIHFNTDFLLSHDSTLRLLQSMRIVFGDFSMRRVIGKTDLSTGNIDSSFIDRICFEFICNRYVNIELFRSMLSQCNEFIVFFNPQHPFDKSWLTEVSSDGINIVPISWVYKILVSNQSGILCLQNSLNKSVFEVALYDYYGRQLFYCTPEVGWKDLMFPPLPPGSYILRIDSHIQRVLLQ